ncbi:MAG: hypothetical protein AAF191_10295, partial [Verrucomicrobiota bacterium]
QRTHVAWVCIALCGQLVRSAECGHVRLTLGLDYSPYNVVDVRGFRSGELAIDPTTNKVFRIP